MDVDDDLRLVQLGLQARVLATQSLVLVGEQVLGRRLLPNGSTVQSEVLEAEFSSGFPPDIPPSFKLKVRNLASRPRPPSVVHNYVNSGQVAAMGPGASATGNTFIQQTVDISTIRETFAEAKRVLAAVDLDDDTREIIDAQAAVVDKQLSKPNPNPRLLLPMITTMATALGTVGAAGSGVEILTKLFHLLGG